MWNKIKNLFSKSPEVEDPDDWMTIWGVTDGPIAEDEEGPWYVVAKVSVGEEVSFTNIYFETFPEAYEFVKHFKTNFDPITMRVGEAYED